MEKSIHVIRYISDSLQEISDNFTSKNRNVIRKALKSGTEVYRGRNQSPLEEFIPLYETTMEQDNATEYYYFTKEFYLSIIEYLKYNRMFYYAVKDSAIASIAMIQLIIIQCIIIYL